MAEHQDHAQAERAERLDTILQRLAKEGMTQRSVAAELNVPPNYLSDLRHGRRVITDQFCRTFSQVFQVRCAWLSDGEGPESLPNLSTPLSAAAGNLLLPVLQEPYAGDPQHCPSWDGSRAEIAGAAAAAAGRAITPYLLRLTQKDSGNRLQPGDLILVSQESAGPHEIGIASYRNSFVLVRRGGQKWLTLATDKPLVGKVEIVGQCLAVVWSKL